jgi:hypothetical protein
MREEIITSNKNEFLNLKIMKILFPVLFIAIVGSSCANKKNAVEHTDPANATSQVDPVQQDSLKSIEFPEILESNKGDDYTINSVEIVGNQLSVNVTYGGGCKEHEFELLGDQRIMKSLPPQMNVVLKHNANQDMCRALITTTIVFDLTPAQKYAGGQTLVLRLLDHQERIMYNF